MSDLLQRLGHVDPPQALQLSRKAPTVLSRPALSSSFFPLSLFVAAETPDTWSELESLFFACLKTGDDKSAHLALERLTQRFGPQNERVMGLRGLYQEAVAEDDAELDGILDEYEKLLKENPMNVPINKRRVALLRYLGHLQNATEALVECVEVCPTDAEAWCELSEVYQIQGMSSQAIFSLEEALLITPNAWNLHARLGEVEYAASASESLESSQSLLTDAIKRFSRSIELCDDYLRGYYGLKLATHKLLESGTSAKQTPAGSISREVLKDLNELATRKLESFVKSPPDQSSAPAQQSEVIAAKALLDRYRSSR